jgi:hypothetical protein
MRVEDILRARAEAVLKTGAERRRDSRSPLLGYVYLSYQEHDDKWVHYVPGLTVNKSRSGLCIFTDRPIKEGIEVRAQLHPCACNDRRPAAERTARVKWCRRVGHELYKVGLSVDGTQG